MDLVTQGLLGSVVAQAAYGKKLGKKAAFWGLVIGILPDTDTIMSVFGPWVSLNTHRTFTHSIFLEMLASVPIGLICRRWAKSEDSKVSWIIMTALCLVTHPILDLFTSYGTEILWPFSFKRYALDGVGIVDLFYSIPLLAVTWLGLRSRLSGSKLLQRLAIGAFVITSTYLFSGYTNSQNLAKLGKELFAKEGFNAVEVRAMPTNFNIILFRVVGKDAENNFMCIYLTPKSHKIVSQETFKSEKDEFVEKALNHKNGQIFLRFCQGMCCTKREEINGEQVVTLNDMRYGFVTDLKAILFQAKVFFDKDGNIKNFVRIKPQIPNIWNELKATFREAILKDKNQ